MSINKQYNINKKYINFANILALALPKQFPKICEFCGEVFEYVENTKGKEYIFCPICNSKYYIVYNELNDFFYLEFVGPTEVSFLK